MTESNFQTFEIVGALVVVLDVDGRIVHWNHRCSDLTGYALEEVRGRALWDFALIAEEVEPVRAIFATMVTSDRPTAYSNFWLTKIGERRRIAWSHTLAKDPDGGIQFIIKTGIDLTGDRLTDDLREANQQMVSATIRAQELSEEAAAALTRSEESERQLRAMAEFREMFIGIVGHDLRNPLGTIVFSTELLLHSGHLDAEERRAVTRIVSSTDRMSRMILQLLDLTRARLGGGIPLDARPIDLRDVCRNVVDEFGAPIRLEIEGDVTGTWDPDRLAEALSNIAGNAIDHAWSGTAVVIRARPQDATVVVEIINQGEPIPTDLLPFIFEPFRQGRREMSRTGHLGLGLYIAKQIVLGSGGTLDARSVGGTTTFAMCLPRQKESKEPLTS